MTEDRIRALVHELHANLGTIRITLDLLTTPAVSDEVDVDGLVQRAGREVSRLAAGLDGIVALATAPGDVAESGLLDTLEEVAAELRISGLRVVVSGSEAEVPVPARQLHVGLRALLGYLASGDGVEISAEVVAGDPASIRVRPVPVEVGARALGLLAHAASATALIDGDSLVVRWEGR